MEAVGKIYKIVNDINDKVYIGVTSRNLDDRFSEHCFDKRSTSQIHEAIEQLGWPHFKIVELESAPFSKIYEQREKWIYRYNSYTNGYNNNQITGANIFHDCIWVVEPDIIFESAQQMVEEISKLTSWSSSFCTDKIKLALDNNERFLDFTLKFISALDGQISSIEDRENWIKDLNSQYTGKRIYSKELDLEFRTVGEAANYLYKNNLYNTDNKYPIQSLITLINAILKGKNDAIQTNRGVITFEQFPGEALNNEDSYKEVQVRCLELNRQFNSQKEAADFMVNNGYWKKIKLKTAISRINNMVYGGFDSYKGYTFTKG